MKKVNKIVLFLTFVLSSSLYACYEYDSVVELTGKLEKREYPGAPNYKDISKGDAIDSGFYLVLNEKICVNGNESSESDESTDRAKENIDLVQLVLDKHQILTVENNIGKVVKLKGSLVDAFTVHHHAKLLLKVSGSN